MFLIPLDQLNKIILFAASLSGDLRLNIFLLADRQNHLGGPRKGFTTLLAQIPVALPDSNTSFCQLLRNLMGIGEGRYVAPSP